MVTFVPNVGPVPCSLLLVGERPGKDEARRKVPFIGPSGDELDRYLGYAGLERGMFRIANLVPTYNAGKKPTDAEIEEWMPALLTEIAQVQPEIIVLAGAYSAKAVMRMSGHADSMDDCHGRLFDSGFGPQLYPVYHPASGLHKPEMQPHIVEDFKRLGRIVRGEQVGSVDVVDELQGWERYEPGVSGLADRIAIDTEGSARNPWCLTYSKAPGTGQFVKGELDYDKFRALLTSRTQANGNGSGLVVYLHNSLHDLAVLRSLGISLSDSAFRDTMVWAYLLCLEPQGLKQLARRHCGMQMQSYEDIIGEYGVPKYLHYLEVANCLEWPKAAPYALVENGKARVYKPKSVGTRIKKILDDYGKKPDTDLWARWHDVDPMLREPVEEALGPMPEATLDDVPMQRAVWYATRDADATIRIAPILESMIAAEGLAEVSEIDHAIIPMIDRMQYIGMPVDAAALKRLEDKCTDRMNQVHYAIYQATGADINPDSHDQVRELLFGQLKLPTKELKLTKITKEASTNDKNLERLIRLHPVVGLIQDYREASKVRGTFAIGVGRQVQADGRVHPNLRITRVSSGRLAASNPNLLAIPVRSEIGKEVRDCFVAPDGRILASHDLDQIEMRLMMWESGDPVGIAAFLSGKDIHTETAATMFGISVGNVNKELHRKPGKIVGFGIINGISAHGLVDQMALYRAYKADGSYWTEDDCERMIKAWFGIYRQVPMFMEAAAAEARRYGRVRDRWGRLRYLPAIHSSIERMREEAARQATSHKIQAGAQGIMKIGMAKCWRAIREIWRREGIGAVEPLLQIHDELIVELQERPDLQEEWERTAIGCLTGKGDSRMQWMEIKAKGGFNHSWGKLKD